MPRKIQKHLKTSCMAELVGYSDKLGITLDYDRKSRTRIQELCSCVLMNLYCCFDFIRPFFSWCISEGKFF